MSIRKKHWDKLTLDDIDIEFGPAAVSEEISTWKELYGIEARYKARCCGRIGAEYWLEQILGEWPNSGGSPDDLMKTLSRDAEKRPFVDAKFLKTAFLIGCERVGLF